MAAGVPDFVDVFGRDVQVGLVEHDVVAGVVSVLHSAQDGVGAAVQHHVEGAEVNVALKAERQCNNQHGREQLDGENGDDKAEGDRAGLEAVLRQGAMALPRFAPGGPFAGTGRIINDEKLTSAGRGALATLYCALVADSCLDRLGAGPLVLADGPLAENPLFVPILQSLRPEGAILPGRRQEAIVPAARFLAGCFAAPAEAAPAVAGPLLTNAAMLQDYKKTWLAACV